MRLVNMLVGVVGFVLFSHLGCGLSRAADPSGTWRWDLEMNGNTIKNVLKLQLEEEGKVTGVLEADDRKIKVEQGRVQGEQLQFSIQVELDRQVTVQFAGKQSGDNIQGTFTAKTDDESREFDWNAKRSVALEDALGTWLLNIETPDGRTLKPELRLKETAGELQGSYASDGRELPTKQLKLKDNYLYFEIDGEYEGSTLHVEFKLRPYGSKLKGKLEYSLNGDSGEIDVTGQRQPGK